MRLIESLRWIPGEGAGSFPALVGQLLSQPLLMELDFSSDPMTDPTPQQSSSATDSISATLSERGKRYGRFFNHAMITQHLKDVIFQYASKHRADGSPWLAPDQQEALDMICHKIGRILNGDPDYDDSWHDIAGYAQLVADRLNGQSK